MTTIAEAFELALAHHQGGNLTQAEHIYQLILQADPGHADARHLSGVVALQQGQHARALTFIQQAIAQNPYDANFHCHLGAVHDALGQLHEAAASFRQALRLRPDFPQAHFNLGNTLRAQGFLDEAVACYRQALRLRPDLPEAYANLGCALTELDMLDDAVPFLQDAVRLHPDKESSLNNLGAALAFQGRLDEAIACFGQVLQINSANVEAHCHLGGSWLLQGDFQRGWPEYEWRLLRRNRDQSPGVQQRRWDGSPLDGRTILLHAEQGLGDTIQFIRYALQVHQRGGHVLVECQTALLEVLRGCPGFERLVPQGSELPAYDVQAPLMSLPGQCGTTLANIPAKVPYLFADSAQVELWRKELAGVPGFKVGICWQGNPSNKNDRRRSIPLKEFAPLARMEGVRLVSLQKGPGSEQLAEVAGRFLVSHWGQQPDSLGTFADTAALMHCLDLVVTCDTAVAHLAGALGIPVWVALPFMPDWRWLLGREDTPWYPTMRLFRQKRPREWGDVFKGIACALWQLLESGRRGRRDFQ